MKLLLISDEESPYLWDYFKRGRLDDIDLIISAGDLKASYLSFLVTMGHAPLLYVHGNHDIGYESQPPEGCDCIDGRIVCVNGLRILGLGGSYMYNRRPHQYTEKQMRLRILRLMRKIRAMGGVDIVVTHAPVAEIGDFDDPCHRGFKAFRSLLDKYHPKYLVHGHIHLSYYPNLPRIHQYQDTMIINACGKYILEIPDPVPNPSPVHRIFPMRILYDKR